MLVLVWWGDCPRFEQINYFYWEFCGGRIDALAFGHPDLQTSHHPTSACGDFPEESIRITDEIFINLNTLLNRLLLALADKRLAPSVARTTLNEWILRITGVFSLSVLRYSKEGLFLSSGKGVGDTCSIDSVRLHACFRDDGEYF
jgi:hypothetical protein